MKKALIVLLTVLTIILIAIYVFIPSSININKSVSVDNNIKAVYRCFSDYGNWHKWWPQNSGTKQVFSLDGNTYSIKYNSAVSIFIDIQAGSLLIPSSINFLPDANNNARLNWNAEIQTSSNPFKRVQLYFAAKKAAGQMSDILKRMSEFGSSVANLYGIDIKRESVKDSVLVSLQDSSNGFPSTEKIYSLIQQLRTYVHLQQATQVDSPMLNIFTKDNLHYQFKVALPTNRPLPSAGNIEYKWMLPGGNILTTDVKGGQQRIDSAFAILEDYIMDYELKAPAIPFYSLLSNRAMQKDSSQWITRIYYPVMYYHD